LGWSVRGEGADQDVVRERERGEVALDRKINTLTTKQCNIPIYYYTKS